MKKGEKKDKGDELHTMGGGKGGKKKKKGLGKYREDMETFGTAEELFNKLGFNTTFNKLDNTPGEDSEKALTIAGSYADPTSGGFVGQESDYQRDFMKGAGTLVENAGKRSQEMQDLVKRFQSGLDGLTAEENSALRDSAMEEVDRAYQEQIRSLSKMKARGGQAVAMMGKLGRDNSMARKDLERDLLIKNVDIKNDRADKYGGFLSGLEGDEFGRSKDALEMFGKSAYDIRQQNSDMSQKALDTYAKLAGGRDDFLRKGNIFNLGQEDRQNALRTTGITGLANFLQNSMTSRRANKIAATNAKKSGTGQPSTGTGGDAGFYDAVKNIYKNQFGLTDEEIAGIGG